MLAAVDTTPTRGEFREFYEENFYILWRQLRRLGVRNADAADVAHDVFVLAYNHFDEIPAHANFWLARVCFETVRNYRRKVARRRERLTPRVIEAAIDEQAANDATSEIVLEALDRMPEAQRMLLLRYHVQEESLHALAKSLGCARSTLQLRLAAAERAFEGWLETLLDVDAEPSSRTRLFASFSLAGLLPREWESSEVLDKARLDGWQRLSSAIDAAKMAAGAPRSEAAPSIETCAGALGGPAKLALVFSVALPGAIVCLLLGYLGADVASAQTVVSPSVASATMPMAVINEALVKNGRAADAFTAMPGMQAPSPASTSTADKVPVDVAILRNIKNAIIDGHTDLAVRLIADHQRRWPDSSHELERQHIIAAAIKIKKTNDAKKASEAAKKQKKAADEPKP
ncbi:sigma-70 family RNA polymerase sigma factor [Polyangium spumosum]|uniref:Sigma-70 family RNA polymerase sigma factor n=1 Tax=Polyangium spumosum TaxID=889282 RepID=A0A6N7PQB8_9BACT|nr:sigma-70 family RNA polymerase sigma factor [Polyangium spumosum]MRG93817.1 sigma-70 family RNA polymerase sigma factor [Polyangium spumosum]